MLPTALPVLGLFAFCPVFLLGYNGVWRPPERHSVPLSPLSTLPLHCCLPMEVSRDLNTHGFLPARGCPFLKGACAIAEPWVATVPAGETRHSCSFSLLSGSPSSTALEHSSFPQAKAGFVKKLLLHESPCERVQLREWGLAVESYAILFCRVAFHICECIIFCCSFVSYLGFIMKLIYLECSQTLFPGFHASGQGLRES